MDPATRHALALWAAACAERVLSHFEAERPHDHRPRTAIAAARAWEAGALAAGAARAAAFAAHGAAREAVSPAACAAARAAAHAAASAHVGTHAPHAANYALSAAGAAVEGPLAAAAAEAERRWQDARLAEPLQREIAHLRSRARGAGRRPR